MYKSKGSKMQNVPKYLPHLLILIVVASIVYFMQSSYKKHNKEVFEYKQTVALLQTTNAALSNKIVSQSLQIVNLENKVKLHAKDLDITLIKNKDGSSIKTVKIRERDLDASIKFNQFNKELLEQNKEIKVNQVVSREEKVEEKKIKESIVSSRSNWGTVLLFIGGGTALGYCYLKGPCGK